MKGRKTVDSVVAVVKRQTVDTSERGDFERQVLCELYRQERQQRPSSVDVLFLMINAYNYGYMNGKKAERKRRKHEA